MSNDAKAKKTRKSGTLVLLHTDGARVDEVTPCETMASLHAAVRKARANDEIVDGTYTPARVYKPITVATKTTAKVMVGGE